jgi:ABC-type multidrug transport system fused ATPase/permease subunit
VSAKSKAPDRIEALRLLLQASRPHRRALLVGSLATVGVVAMRLALPWPLRGVLENVFPGQAGTPGPLASPFGMDPIITFCLLYLVFSIGVGSFEWVQRLWMARLASRTAHELRSIAVARVRSDAPRSATDNADLITRVVGDVARIRADLKGILIHLGQNGLLLLAITVLFLVLAPKLGMLFLVGGLLAVMIGYVTVEEVAETTSRHRRKESKYAAAIQDDPDEVEAISRSSTKKDVRTTRIIGRATWLVHAAVAATIALALWIGVQDVRTGLLAPGELFLFIAYAITIQRRAVMIGRQVARGGKLLANTDRLAKMIAAGESEPVVSRGLSTGLTLQAVRLKRFAAQHKRARLGPIDLEVRRGERLLVLGGEGSGKSSLLGLMAGRSQATGGTVLWDGEDVTDRPELLRRSVDSISDEPAFGRSSVRALLGLRDGQEPAAEDVSVLDTLGAWRVVKRLGEGLEQRLPSSDLSPRERRALLLGGVVVGDAGVWVLDNPVDSRRSRDRERLSTILDRAEGRTIVVSLRQPVLVDRFTRVISMSNGKIAFDGPPEQWEAWRKQLREIRSASR